MPDLLQLDNDSKIKFCNAWHAMARHYTVCKQCQVYLIEGDDDLCAVGKHLVAKELCYAECRVEIANVLNAREVRTIRCALKAHQRESNNGGNRDYALEDLWDSIQLKLSNAEAQHNK